MLQRIRVLFILPPRHLRRRAGRQHAEPQTETSQPGSVCREGALRPSAECPQRTVPGRGREAVSESSAGPSGSASSSFSKGLRPVIPPAGNRTGQEPERDRVERRREPGERRIREVSFAVNWEREHGRDKEVQQRGGRRERIEKGERSA